MKNLILFCAAALAFSASAATAESTRGSISQGKPSAPLRHMSIPDTPLHPALAANAAFGAAIEAALLRPAPSVVNDPSGRYAIQVASDGQGRVIRLMAVGSNQGREWRLGSGAGYVAVGATIAEVMAAVGQQRIPVVRSVAPLSPQKTK